MGVLVLEGVGDFIRVPAFGSDEFGVVRGKVIAGVGLRAVDNAEDAHESVGAGLAGCFGVLADAGCGLGNEHEALDDFCSGAMWASD